MAKNTIISFYDVCLPDYFGGHHQPVLQCPVDGATTRKQLYDGLLSEVNLGVIDYEMEENNLDYDAIRKAIFDCLFFDPECDDNDTIFPTLEIWPEEEDGIESCYAFFVVDWEEEEGR
jgi:hypothetical protein